MGLDLDNLQGGALAFSRWLFPFRLLALSRTSGGSVVYLLCHGLPRLGQSLWNAPARSGPQHMFVPSVLGGFSRSLSVRDWEPYEVDAIAVGAMLPSSEVSCGAVT